MYKLLFLSRLWAIQIDQDILINKHHVVQYVRKLCASYLFIAYLQG